MTRIDFPGENVNEGKETIIQEILERKHIWASKVIKFFRLNVFIGYQTGLNRQNTHKSCESLG